MGVSMAAGDRQPTEERRDNRYDDTDAEPTNTWFPYPVYGWLPWSARREREEPYEAGPEAEGDVDRSDGSWLDEGLITLLFLVGIGLFIFPEPATSGLGVVLIATATVLWLLDWLT